MNDFIEFFLPVLLVFVLVIGGLFGFCVTVDYLDCRGFENGTGIKTRWEWGCYAQVDGKWVPSKYVFANANELRVK